MKKLLLFDVKHVYTYVYIFLLPNDKNVDLSKFKAPEEDSLDVTNH